MQASNEISIFSIVNTFYRLVLGDFSRFDELGKESQIYWILWIFFLVSTLVLMVIMLNLLIAMISNTFSRVMEDNVLVDVYEKTKLINEIDEKMSEEACNKLASQMEGQRIVIAYTKAVKKKVRGNKERKGQKKEGKKDKESAEERRRITERESSEKEGKIWQEKDEEKGRKEKGIREDEILMRLKRIEEFIRLETKNIVKT